MKILLILFSALVAVNGQWNPHWWSGRSGIINLFEWRWVDIADECETFLALRGFAGVQTSPPSENLIISGRPWWERYHPGSYLLDTRSGSRAQFADMVRRCNAVGVRIYPDVVISEMANQDGFGTAGSYISASTLSFPAVPYGPNDFIQRCSDPPPVGVCSNYLPPGLKLESDYVRSKVVDYMNDLISLGIAGFQINSVKNISPINLGNILVRLNNLNTMHGFAANSRPFIIQDLVDLGSEVVTRDEYLHLGTITEYRFSAEIGRIFRGYDLLRFLRNFGEGWGFMASASALTFIDSYNNQRGQGGGGANVLNFKTPKQYKMATAFHFAWPYGIPRIMSSYDFVLYDQGPPADVNGNIRPPIFNADGSCAAASGWICEHRWRQIFNMVGFRNVVGTATVANWWENSGGKQIAFSRGNRGFIAFNNENFDLNQILQTGLPAGIYCELASGGRVGNSCTGTTITVDSSGNARFVIMADATDGFMAIHIDARL